MDGTRRQDHFARRLDRLRDLPANKLHAAGTVAIEEDSRRVGVQQQGEVGRPRFGLKKVRAELAREPSAPMFMLM